MRILLVRARGVEPLWISPHGPEPCASANSAMPARLRLGGVEFECPKLEYSKQG